MWILHKFVTFFSPPQAEGIFKVLSQIVSLTVPGKLSLPDLLKVRSRMSLILSGDHLTPSQGLLRADAVHSGILHLAEKERSKCPQNKISEGWS